MIKHSLYITCATIALSIPGALAAQDSPAPSRSSQGSTEGGNRRTSSINVTPYIEASQIVSAQLSPGNDVVTYTSLAAGIEASMTGRNSAASVSLRYERRIGYDDSFSGGDTISGIARASLAVVPRAVTFEAGGMAARTRVEGNGSTSLGGFAGNGDATSQIYSVYAGPSVKTQIGAATLTGHYRLGYTRVEAPDSVVVTPGEAPADVFDDSITHSAGVRVGFAPNTVLPIGVGVGGGWNEQTMSNLDQRIRDRHVRADVSVPVTRSLALIGGVGYEDVQVSSRDALRDIDGDPVIGTDGRYVTDKSSPRQIAYETDGLIWDAGVMWRPSRRTSLSATVGRRYGSTTYYGNLSYAASQRSALNISVYDSISGFGGSLVNQLAGLPTEFDAFLNPITGNLGGCVAGADGANCLTAGLGSVRSTAFRGQGVNASYSHKMGRTNMGIGAGYDRRKFIAAAGTILGAANGLADENFWASAFVSQQLDRQSSLSANATANWFKSGLSPDGAGLGYSASLAYNRSIMGSLSATAAVGLDGISRENLEDFTNASALLGLRYSF